MIDSLFQENGFVHLADVVPPAECDRLAARVRSIGDRSPGCRCLLDFDWCREVGETLRARLASDLACVAGSVIVQSTYFHKTKSKNWLVAWHQDRSIPVECQVQSAELTGWSQKQGMTFVHAPDNVLTTMFAVRLYLDDSTVHNGPLRVIAGSHRGGSLSQEEINHVRNSTLETTCLVRQGGVLVMRPLLLHASSKSTSAEPRRVLHFLFGPAELPDGLRWNRAV